MLTASQLASFVLYSPGFPAQGRVLLLIKWGVYPPINIAKMISAGMSGDASPG